MSKSEDRFVSFTADEIAEVRASLWAEAVDTARIAIRVARDDPSEQNWYRVVEPLPQLSVPTTRTFYCGWLRARGAR